LSKLTVHIYSTQICGIYSLQTYFKYIKLLKCTFFFNFALFDFVFCLRILFCQIYTNSSQLFNKTNRIFDQNLRIIALLWFKFFFHKHTKRRIQKYFWLIYNWKFFFIPRYNWEFFFLWKIHSSIYSTCMILCIRHFIHFYIPLTNQIFEYFYFHSSIMQKYYITTLTFLFLA
jgi:hypothetical protein